MSGDKELHAVRSNIARYRFAVDKGHYDYCEEALENERFYVGRGMQWSDEERDVMINELGRPVFENNGIFPAVNTAVGMQIRSRMEIAYKGRNDAAGDEEVADVLSKVAMQICYDNQYQWKETEMYSDGIIMQRGYFDIRMRFTDNVNGEIYITKLHPFDVIPDPEANSYDPDEWKDVMVVRWYTLDDIEQLYGSKVAAEVETKESTSMGETDEITNYEKYNRMQFGGVQIVDMDDYHDQGVDDDMGKQVKRYLIIDRQHYKWDKVDVLITAEGDVLELEHLSDEQKEEYISNGAVETKKVIKRVRWTVTCGEVLLHDDWSPYKTFTIVPFFPYFRSGITRGLVDNAVDPQRILNKTWSLFVELLGRQSNTGWIVEEGSLTNMSTADLETQGNKNGIVVEHKKGSTPPQKITPGPFPTNIDRAIERAEFAIKTTTGMSDAMQGLNSREISGKAIETKQYQGQTQLAAPIDNLGRTRFIVARKILQLIQQYYITKRVIAITSPDLLIESTKDTEVLTLNEYDPIEDRFINDVTAGKYDVVISSKPVSDTFRDNQFQQAREMRTEMGIGIPDEYIISMSNLSNKQEIIEDIKAQKEAMAQGASPGEEDKIQAEADKIRAEAVNKQIDALYSAIQAGGVIAENPNIAPLADTLLRSAGYIDKDKPPIVPGAPAGQNNVQQMTGTNTSPAYPAPPAEAGPGPAPGAEEIGNTGSPAVGANRGIETQRIEGGK